MLKATILLEDLKKNVSLSFHAVSSRSPLPILTNFLLEVKDGALTLNATDLEIGIRTVIPAKTTGEGRVAIPAKTFMDLINNIDEERVEIEEKEKNLVLVTKKTKTSFPTSPAEEFPQLYEEKGEKKARFIRKDFEKEMSGIVYAAAQDTTRPALSGVLVKTEEKETVLVATDGYRLSLYKRVEEKAGGKKEEVNLLISSRVLKEVLGIKNDAGYIDLFASEKSNQVLFESGDALVVGRLIEAEYPDYEKIIPQDFSTKTSFDREGALAAVRSCSVFAREAANIIKLKIGEKEVLFSASAAAAGENEVKLEAKTQGEENEIAFNARYLLEFLSNTEDEEVVFEMTSPLSPGVFRPKSSEDFMHLIMPIRIQE